MAKESTTDILNDLRHAIAQDSYSGNNGMSFNIDDTDIDIVEDNEEDDTYTSIEDSDITVMESNADLVCKLLSYMNFFKFCHWTAESMDIHKAIDDFYDKLSSYTDEISEVLQGIDGQFKMSHMDIIPMENTYSLMDGLNMLKQDIQNFVEDCNDDINYTGAVDISTTFLKDISQYAYLFRLCK